MRLPDRTRSAAVLIGTSTSTSGLLPDLPSVRNNLDGLAAVLTDPDHGCVDRDSCRVLANPKDSLAINRTLLEVGRRAEDMLLVYFAGHGLVGPDDAELYLALPDTEPDSLGFSALRYAALRQVLMDSGRIRATNRIVILDSCFSGRAIPSLSAEPAEQLTAFAEIEGVYLLTSTSVNRTALAPTGALYTAFTGALLELLTGGVPGDVELLSLNMIYRRLHQVMRTRGLPSPQQANSQTAAQLALVRNRAFAPAPAPPTQTLVVVRWADTNGTGFSRDWPDDVPQRYWRAGEDLLATDLGLPPQEIRETAGHPVWTLRSVPVDGQRHWCFAVQGIRGAYGIAGTVLYAFAPHERPPADVWEEGARLAATLYPRPDVPRAFRESPSFVQCLSQLFTDLTDLAADQRVVSVPVGPAEAAEVIAAALRVLPVRTVEDWSWTTCALRPAGGQVRTVSGAYPAEFHGPAAIAERRDTAGAPRHAREGSHRLGVAALAALVAQAKGPAEADAAALRQVGSVQQLVDDPHRILSAILDDPRDALDMLRRSAVPELNQYLLRALLDRQRQTRDNVLDLPTVEAPDLNRWHKRLARQINDLVPDVRQRADVIRGWTSDGGVLGHKDDLDAAGPWLMALDLTPRDEPDLFPTRLDVIVATIHRRGSGTVFAEVIRRGDPAGVLAEAVDAEAPLDPEAAADVVAALAAGRREADPQPLLEAAAGRAKLEHEPERWLARLLGRLVERDVPVAWQGHVMRHGLLALGPSRPLTDAQLRVVCAQIGIDEYAPPGLRVRLSGGTVRPAPAGVPSVAARRYLVPTERFVSEWRPHRLQFAARVWTAGMVTVAAIVAAMVGLSHIGPIGMGLVVGTLSAGWLVAVDQGFYRFVLTDQRAMMVSGLLGRRFAAVRLGQITDVRCVQSRLGRVLSYGTLVLTVRGIGPALAHVRQLPHPRLVRRRILESISELIAEDDD